MQQELNKMQLEE